MDESEKSSKYSIASIFYDVQFSDSNHPAFKKILTDIYKKTTNKKKFIDEFLKCLTITLTHEEKSANVEKTLDFAAVFAVSFCSALSENENCPLLEGVFQFIFENHDCQTQLVRLRICQLMNRLLDNMGPDATVLEDTYNKIAENMLLRLKDSMTSVRTQAVYALHRLQSPSDVNCEIIAAFKYHMMHDPSNEVRKAVIQKIAPTKATLVAVLTRVNDVKDSVRLEAYHFFNRLVIRQFTIKQRQFILESGLNDRAETVRNFVLHTLVPNWLKYFNYNYCEFLECIQVEKITETAIKVLKAIFQKQHDVVLESSAKDCISTQKIPYDTLNMRTVIYWRALAEYVRPTDTNDKYQHIFDQILPDLTPFCNYIRGYVIPPQSEDQNMLSEAMFVPMSGSSTAPHGSSNLAEQSQNPHNSTTNMDSAGSQMSAETSNTGEAGENATMVQHKLDEAILVHLLEMCKVYDLADEVGRNNLRQMCLDLLQSPQVSQQSTVAVLASLLDLAVPNIDSKLSVMAELITELREPLHSLGAVYVPDVLLMEAQEKKVELIAKLKDLAAEMEIAQELGDDGRVQELKVMQVGFEEELKIMNTVAPHEPGRNLKNDPETLKKCLTIVVEILKKGKVLKMNATLYSLMQNFVVPTLKLKKIEGEFAPLIRNLALQALGIFCVLDVELAKEHILLFCFNIAINSLSVTALKCVFDLLHVYGLSTFNVVDPYSGSGDEEGNQEEGQRRPNLVPLLTSLLNSDSPEMRKTAVIGLCKLSLVGRIKSADLISKLIQLWYNPTVENDAHIRQPLGAFFTMFAEKCPHAPPLLQKAFLLTLKELFKVEVTDPMAAVDIDGVANLLTDFTRSGFNPHMTKDYCIHNQLAIQMCEEVLSDELERAHSTFLLKVVSHLELNYDLTTDICLISSLVSKIVKTISKEDKAMFRIALKLENIIQMRQERNKTVSTVNNTLISETSLKSTVSRPSQLQLIKESGSDGDEPMDEQVDEEEEEEQLSQEMSAQCRIDESGVTVIPGTPETSDSELDDDSCPSAKDVSFKGFADGFKGFSSSFKGFKEPPAPSTTVIPPAETSFKLPKRTPRKTSAKSDDISGIPAKKRTPEKTTKKPVKTPVKTPKKSVKTPAKRNVKTPTPAKSRGGRSQSPEDTEMTPSTQRVTRSARKRKIQ